MIEKEKLLNNLKKLALLGQYKQAAAAAKKALKVYPGDFMLRYQYAKLLGDWADELPHAKRMAYKKEAIRILKPLTKSLRGVNYEVRFGLCLNYYYQSYAFYKMYNFGKRFKKYDSQRAHYAMGLGASERAADLFNKNKKTLARIWAKKSVMSWQKYNLKSEKYYFAHYSYSKALAILGQDKLARQTLEKAARLSKRTVSDWEFSDVLKIINKNN